MPPPESDLYAVLGLDRQCTAAQIRAAYRLLAKAHHPDVNPAPAAASTSSAGTEVLTRIQQLNAAYEILGDPGRREAYDAARPTRPAGVAPARSGKPARNLAQDLPVRIGDLFGGTRVMVEVRDPAHPHGPERYELVVPPDTAPGTRFRLRRTAPFERGFVSIRVRPQPDFRFQPRGTDLRCDLRITSQRAAQGGQEALAGATGTRVLVKIPPGIGRGEILRLAGEGLPKARGGRGDLLVRIVYRPEMRFTRSPTR